MIDFKLRPFVPFVPFVNITPINPNVLMIVDLGELHDPECTNEGAEVHSSFLPPTSVNAVRCSHGMEEGVEENAQGIGETGLDGSAGDTSSSQGEPNNSEELLCSSRVSKAKEHQRTVSDMMIQGVEIARSLGGIKKEKIKTYWFLQWNKAAIGKPPVLYTSVQLELRDIFINQFYVRQRETQVQVWLLVAEGSSENHSYGWKQVRD